MPTPREISLRAVPRGLSDTLIGDNSNPGACTALENLVFDPSTPGIFQCRPAVDSLTDFSEFSTTGVVSVAYQLNGIVDGMIASTIYAGKDQPFSYKISNDTFISISGVSSGTLPSTQSTSGDWTPPVMDFCGVNLVVTHPGFSGSNKFGWFDLTNPAAPVWNAGNTTTNLLPAVPSSVAQFNNRFYFAVGNAAYFTDALTLTITNASQVLTIGDSSPIIGFAPLPVSSTDQNVLQGLIVFKATSTFIITGDFSTFDLAVNEISTSIGTSSPRSIAQTPQGVRFVTVDGIRTVDFYRQMSDPDPDLALPFIYALHPSRISAAYNFNIYRVCVENGNALGTPFQEFWQDLKRGGWTGPNSFRQDMAVPYKDRFIIFSNSLSGELFSSAVAQTGSDSFVENEVQLTFNYQTSPMTDLGNLYANCVVKSSIEIALQSNGNSYSLTGQDEQGSSLATASIIAPFNLAIWDAFDWGDGSLWGASPAGIRKIPIPWNQPLVFNRLSAQIKGPSSAGLKLGAFNLAYRPLSYMLLQ